MSARVGTRSPKIAKWSKARPTPVEPPTERRLAALLSADIKGYSRLMGEDEEGTLQTLTTYREVMANVIEHYRGRVVNWVGDNVLAEFASAVDAVQGAWAIQEALKTRNAPLPAVRRMELRIGINVGDVLVQDTQLYGDGVNVAARMEAVADAGGICITGTVYDQVQNKGLLQYEYIGEQMVKNIVHPVRVYRVQMDAEARSQIPIEQPEPLLHFRPFQLDVTNTCLWRGKKRIPLMPKDFAVLHTLVTHAGHVVMHQELFATVWPDTIVSHGVLKVCLRRLRHALDDSSTAPRFIETVHRRGYRFLPPVTTSPLQGAGAGGQGSVRAPQNEVERLRDHTVFAPIPGPRPPVPALVGREVELTQLHRLLEKAMNGERQIVFVTGEPGIGKTTLVNAFLERSRIWELGPGSPLPPSLEPKSQNSNLGVWMAKGQCIEHYGAGEPYLPVLDALGRLCRTPKGEQITAVLHQYAPIWLMQMPALMSSTDLEALQRRVMGAGRERMLREFVEALDVLTLERGLVLILEDIHWADPSTLALLALLAQRPEPARLLVIATYRPTELHGSGQPIESLLHELYAHEQCVEVALQGLREEDVATYLHERFPDSVFPTRFPEVLYQRTEGNPLFIVSILNDLIARGVIIQVEGKWVVQSDEEPLLTGIPESIRHLATRQRTRLSEEEQQVVAVASVAGAEFSVATLAAALGTTIITVEEQCARLTERQQFLRPAGIAAWPDGTTAARYQFLHALYQHFWHERVSIEQQQQWHLRIGEYKEVAYGIRAHEIAAELAVHFEQAQEYARATRYLAQAAEGAIRRCAHEEAVTHLTKSLELLRMLPDTAERTQQELALHTTLGISLQAVRGYGNPLVEQAYARARALSARVHEPEQLFPVLFGLWQLHLTRAEYSIARTQGDQLLSLAQRSHNPALLTEAHGLVGVTLFHLGEIGAAQSHFEEGMAVYDPAHHRSLAKTYSQDPWVACRSYSAHVLWLRGYPDQALTRVQEALHYARELGHPFSEAFALHDLVFIQQLSDNVSAVRTEVEVLLALAREHGFQHWELAAHGLRGWALAREGESVVGLGLMREGSGIRQNLGSNLRMPYHHARMAELYGQAERPKEGLNQLEKAVTVMTATGERWWEAEIYRLRGELTLQKGTRDGELGAGEEESQKSKGKSQKSENPNPKSQILNPQSEAEACFLKAIEIAQRQQAKSLELRTVMGLFRLRQQQAVEQEAGYRVRGAKNETAGQRESGEARTPELRPSLHASQHPSDRLKAQKARNNLAEAHKMLSAVYSWFTEGFHTQDLKDAKALLEALRY